MEIENIKIKKARLAKGGTVEATFTDSYSNEITVKGKHKCHIDLRTAFASLVPYFADLTEQKEADSIDWSDIESAENVDLLRKIDVTGFSIGGDGGGKFITLTGNRTLSTSRVLNLNSPGVEMESETFEWDHIDDFDVAMENAIYEVKEYVVKRKRDETQASFNFDNPDDPFSNAEATADAPSIEQTEEIVA